MPACKKTPLTWAPAGRELREGGKWLPDQDLNLDKQNQNLLCYRYTIGQNEVIK